MSGQYNPELRKPPLANHDLQSLACRQARALIQLNRHIDPKRDFEQWLVAREISQRHYVKADEIFDEALPEFLYCRMPEALCLALFNEGRIRIDTFALDPGINGSDLPDTPDSPYILAGETSQSLPGLPITLGRRALVFRTWMDPYAHLKRSKTCVLIEDPARFVNCVTEKLDQVFADVGARIERVLHARCFYQWSRLVGTKDSRGLNALSSINAEDAKYFIKPGYGFHDAEFRFVWILDQDFEGHVDIQCPDLLPLCSVFSETLP
jgi:hypothetical protein